MIQINKLVKIYQTKNNKQTALNNVSLTLPSAGMVFITGESGSGKSTLLNLISGLDSISHGSINVDGNHIEKMSENELGEYRSSYLGFIFQDYCLIQDLNIYNNIKTALDIIDDTDYSKIDKILEKVNLTKYKTRHPNELSGGQKQRVAIARAIIKDPKLILCDEPTGNLDSENSKQILVLLKEISKTCLVVIVSHNMKDARKYGDRIIELKDGQIISDYQNDLSHNYLIDDSTLYVSDLHSLSSEELDEINANIGSIKQIQPFNHLSPTSNESNEEIKKVKIEKKKYRIKKSIGITNAFLKHGLVGTLLVSLFTGLLVSTFGMVRSMTSFNASEVIEQAMINNDSKSFTMQKGYYNANKQKKSNYINKLTDEDDALLQEKGLLSEAYKVYNYSIRASYSTKSLIRQGSISPATNLRNMYAQESYGVLVTDKEYVTTLFDGDIKLLAGTMSGPKYGVYITDYLADSIKYYQPEYSTYESLIGQYKNFQDNVQVTNAYISGIIKTDYKSKYGKLIKDYLAAKDDGNTDEMQKLSRTKEMGAFSDDVNDRLGLAYSFNPNFINDSRVKESRSYTRIDRASVRGTISGKKLSSVISSEFAYRASDYGVSLEPKTISLTVGKVNELVNGAYTAFDLAMVLPISGTMKGYSAVNYALGNKDQPEYNLQVTLTYRNENSLFAIDSDKIPVLVSDDVFETLQGVDVFAYAYKFKNVDHASEIYDLLTDVPYVPTANTANVASTIGTTLNAYNGVFSLISTLLAIIAFALVLVFIVSIVNKHKHDIGILKALGASNSDVTKIYAFQIGAIALIVTGVYIIASLALAKVMNNALIGVIGKLMPNSIIPELVLIAPSFWQIFIIIIMIFVSIALGAILPILMIRKIKPMQIIRGNR